MNNKLYKLMNWPVIEEIIYSESDNPHATLGPHTIGGQTLLQAYFPGAEAVSVYLAAEDALRKMEKADEDGFFARLIPWRVIGKYHYEVTYPGGKKKTVQDAYAFEPWITKKDTEKFGLGIHYTVYEKLGAHPVHIRGVEGTVFAVWAPNALRVSVVGDFNEWDGRIHQMRRLWDSGIFEIFIPDVKAGENYKFEIKLKGGLTYLKADPYANAAQLRPDTASVVADISNFQWEDEEWLFHRAQAQKASSPISVYELYLGSFARKEAEKEGDTEYLNYRELAPQIIQYIKETEYTHIELMPVMEHPFDGSWGYQTIGYYAPTARYGSPEDFMYFMNEMHKAGIGVILDWVPAHFPRDAYGLSNFDGTCLYEHMDPRKGAHPHWGTLIYNYGRPQVSNYLIANALFWAEVYHADGIRMDAVASMLYLDYGKKDGEWIANMYGGNENLEAMEFIKHLNSVLHKRNPGILVIAEESTAWPMVTGPLEKGGLGFDIKWNMGWMNDYLGYIKYDPFFRSHHHGELTFSMIYAYSEQFMLVFSHDEVVHGKGSMIGKMPGERENKFKNLRLSYAYMMLHPGRKLLFMGQDIAEFDEWNEERSVEWELLEYPEHKGMHALVKDLNHFYRSLPALSVLDASPEGFEWINSIQAQECCLTFLRKSAVEAETILVAANFAGAERKMKIGVPYMGKYRELLNTEDKKYGGTGSLNQGVLHTVEEICDERPYTLEVSLTPLSLSIFGYEPYTQEELDALEAKRLEEERLVLEKEKKALEEKLKRIEEKKKAVSKKTIPGKAEKSKTPQNKAAAKKEGKL